VSVTSRIAREDVWRLALEYIREHVLVGEGAEEVEDVVDGTDELEVPGKVDDDDDVTM
jgi:O-antigen ligase